MALKEQETQPLLNLSAVIGSNEPEIFSDFTLIEHIRNSLFEVKNSKTAQSFFLQNHIIFDKHISCALVAVNGSNQLKVLNYEDNTFKDVGFRFQPMQNEQAT